MVTGVATATGTVDDTGPAVLAVVVVVVVAMLAPAGVVDVAGGVGAGIESDFLTVLSSCNAAKDVAGSVPYQPDAGVSAMVRWSLWRMAIGGRIVSR